MRKIVMLSALVCGIGFIPACRSGKPRRRTPLIVRGGPLLQNVFPKLTSAFEEGHPEVDLRTDFSCPPCVLTTRVDEGIEMDLFISAGDVELEILGEGGVLDPSTKTPIGTAHLVLAVPPDNPAGIREFGDIHRFEVKSIAIGHPDRTSPGRYARQAFERMGLWAEIEHKLVFTKTGCEALRAVVMGQTDAALLYSFCLEDEAGQPRIIGDVPSHLHEPIVLAVTTGRDRGGPAVDAFVEFIRSPEAQSILREHGIDPAPKADASQGEAS